ncbi:hypothetical protein TraAM80_00964 [Trypanosoma rangeli]|uniref:K Homology domain-containing protein n=1 Tax=Trypanosoma rangeli TaxID=5698 RepID=A0A3R7KQ14_TRYRA|nr:uncharacterized protein TraAM80_00964 [Trypanosoma rangeli]RNF11328.1 hypothetical protein TraAM80_00964 [Trypanosoma rangeli]|eukprot:RNF11328.1 hypothetical protein TraAM80_00964 [Trypanosoma rangeli]
MPTTCSGPPGLYQNLHHEYIALLEELRVLQVEWHSAVSRKLVLEASVTSTTAQGDAVEPIRRRLSELQKEHVLLDQQSKLLQAQIEEAKELYKRACEESSVVIGGVLNEKQKLEEEYMQVMRLADQFDPNLQEDAALVKAALAEQRVEMRMLREALDVVKRSMMPDYFIGSPQHSKTLLVPHSKALVEVPMDDFSVPVPHGRLRLLTGSRGDGLQQLRDRHKVAVSVVCSNDTVTVRVQGHKAGVENCVIDIRRVLSL